MSEPLKFQFLVFDGVEELDLVGAWELVGLLSDRQLCDRPHLVSLNNMTVTAEHGMRFVADHHYADAPSCDVLFVPGGSGARTAMEDENVLRFLQAHSESCEAILSVCTGSYLMQRAGLFSGRRATTHWAFLDHLRSDPNIDVCEERFVTDGNIWSSAGVSAGIDMMLAFIATKFGDEVAASVQLDAEYFPSDQIYGAPEQRRDVSQYIRNLRR